MTRPTRDEAFAKVSADREQEFHAIMVRAGVRPEGSRAEDHRPKRGPVEVPVVTDTAKVLRSIGETGDV
jgi:hypothetical protein